MDVPAEYRIVPDDIPAMAVNVAESYTRFSEGPLVLEPIPDFEAAVQRHRLLDAIKRSSETGQRVKL
jgi:predicted dehydrogenase